MNPRRLRVFGGLAALVVVAGTLCGANAASADSVQVQSYQRASHPEACAAQPGETAWQASWGTDSSWKPTWEQWANGGTGGWTCTRTIVWARSPVAVGSSSATSRVGDIGPGGGLIFLVSGGLSYEMAPKAWSGAGTPDAAATWCDSVPITVDGTSNTVGAGAANTAAMASSVACSSNAAAAVLAYPGTDSSAGQWFLPSLDELNAMCYYSRYLTASPDPTASCSGFSGTAQDPGFASGDYGFPSSYFWSSSQYSANPTYNGWAQNFANGLESGESKILSGMLVRPVRAF